MCLLILFLLFFFFWGGGGVFFFVFFLFFFFGGGGWGYHQWMNPTSTLSVTYKVVSSRRFFNVFPVYLFRTLIIWAYKAKANNIMCDNTALPLGEGCDPKVFLVINYLEISWKIPFLVILFLKTFHKKSDLPTLLHLSLIF